MVEANVQYSSYEEGNGLVCSGQTLTWTRATATKAALSFRIESVDVPSHPPDEEGICSFELARAAAQGTDCSKVEGYTGTFYQALY